MRGSTKKLLQRPLGSSNVLSALPFSISSNVKKTIDPLSEDYQFLEKSKVPSLHFQKSLPRLPIPQLDKTCERYLAAQTPLLSPKDLAEVTKIVDEFKNGQGKSLDEQLRKQDSANKQTSYISGPWFDMYLKDRVPLPLNYNPALVFVNSTPELNSQLTRTTNMIVSSLRFMKSLRAGVLSPEVFHLNPAKSDTAAFRNFVRMLPSAVSWYGAYLYKAYPLDMSQYGNLFNSTRIPRPDRDVLLKDESAQHLVVIWKGNFFKVEVLDQNGKIRPAADIQATLRHITCQNSSANTSSPGVLTAAGRTEWAAARDHIAALSAANGHALNLIDSAIFVVCLDDQPVGEDFRLCMRRFLHGDGFNRWFDKSFSLIVAADGTAGLNFEHSWGDGVAILRYFTDVLKDSNNNPFVVADSTPSTADPASLVQEIKFTLDDSAKQSINKAKKDFDVLCESLAIDIIKEPGFGKSACKKAGVSPDSVIQLAFQVAYHKLHGKFVGTYESCSTAAFKHGRTETVRPCTIATRDFALAFNRSARPDASQLIQLMRNCSAKHGVLTKEAAMGNGFDRHLFALRHLAGSQLPPIFTHASYANINHNILSTSTLGSSDVQMGGFGPVVKDGLGIAYNVQDDLCASAVTSYPPYGDGSSFVNALSETIKEFAQLVGTIKKS